MNLVINILINYLPLICICLVVFFKNKSIKWYAILLAVIMGMVAIIPTVVIQFFIPSSFAASQKMIWMLVSSILIAGLVEEICKALCLCVLPSKDLSIKSFFVLGLILGYSFGSFENIIYMIGGMAHTEIRMITSCLLHSICTGTAAFFVWFLKKKKFHLSLILTPVFVHGIYNFFAGFPGNFWLFAFIVLFYGIFQCSVFYQMFKEDKVEA